MKDWPLLFPIGLAVLSMLWFTVLGINAMHELMERRHRRRLEVLDRQAKLEMARTGIVVPLRCPSCGFHYIKVPGNPAMRDALSYLDSELFSQSDRARLVQSLLKGTSDHAEANPSAPAGAGDDLGCVAVDALRHSRGEGHHQPAASCGDECLPGRPGGANQLAREPGADRDG